MTTKKNEGPLTLAALALENELRTFEELVEDLARLHVNSDKTLQRARQNLEACAEFEQKLAGRLKAFAEAMQQMQAKQQDCMKSALEHAQRIQQRNDARNALLERVNALGLRARDINAPMNELVADEAAHGDANHVLAKIQDVGERLEAVIVEATAVASAAKEEDWQDIARDADVLKQQLQSARNKVLVAQRNVASRAPS
ncbi:MAG TPA: hypothetical protein VM686_11825 [Polyangiaceae bacterium]|nr:hypothetical protein [Polyangiaceae bacterium]